MRDGETTGAREPRLVVGQTYRNQRGEEYYILRRSSFQTPYPYIALDSRRRFVAFRADGRFEKRPCERDLIIA